MRSLKPGFHEQAIVAVYGALSRRGYNAPKRLGVSLHHLDRHAGPDAGPWLPAETHLEAVRGMSLDRCDLDANAWRELGFEPCLVCDPVPQSSLRIGVTEGQTVTITCSSAGKWCRRGEHALEPMDTGAE